MMLHASIVMAVYNGRRYLRQQLESVLVQLQNEDELIIVDDASTDDSVGLLNEYARPAMRVVRNPHNVGVVRTFDRGLALARNPIVFLCDQDDVWLPDKRAAFLSAFAGDPEVRVVVSDAEVIDGEDRLVASSYMETRPGGFRDGLLATLWSNRYLGCAMAIRHEVLAAALPIPSAVPMHDMWLGTVGRVLGRVAYLPTPYLRYRRHDRNTTADQAARLHRMLAWRAMLLMALARRLLSIRLGMHSVH